MLARMSASQGQHSTLPSKDAFITADDMKASFNLFCCVVGIGSLAMPSNYARAGPVFASIALAFMIFANTYATLRLSQVMLVAPSSVKTYGDLGEWSLGKWGRLVTVVSQMGVCLLVPIAFLVLGSTLLDVMFPDSFSQTFWIVFMALMVIPVCLIPTLKESAGMAFAGTMGTLVADIIAVTLVQYNMRGHPAIPKPDVSMHQVLTCFGNLALAYGAAPVVPDLHREHPQPQRMPRVVVLSILAISAFFVIIALVGYTAGGCQLSGNILYSIVDLDNPLGAAPLGFTADRGAIVMAYMFMQMHITIAFSTLMQPAFYMAERIVLGMHQSPAIVPFNPDDELDVDLQQELEEKESSYAPHSTPNIHAHSTSSMIEKTEGRMSHLRVALEFGEEITEEQLAAPYKGAKNTLRYVTLRIAIVVILVITAVVLQDKFLDLQDFTGATAHTTSCLLMPLIIYLRIFWRKMPIHDKVLSAVTIIVCALSGIYVMIDAGENLFTPSDDDEPLFPYCDAELQNEPYYIRNSTN